MKKFVLLLMLVYPVLSWAQVDDLYYVPKKEKTVLVVKSAEDVYFVGDNDVVIEDDVEDVYITDDGDGYYTNDLYDVVDDYTYSTRIIRFHSPRKRLFSNIFWDLMYDCGLSDWYVYDNGYTINIYPTYNNPYYYSNSFYSWNAWNWHRCPFGTSGKILLSIGLKSLANAATRPPFSPIFIMPIHSDSTPVSPIASSKALLAESVVAVIISGNTVVSPRKTSLPSAMTNEMMKNAIQTQLSTIVLFYPNTAKITINRVKQ